MASTKRKRRTVEEARSEILDAAEDIIVTTGPAGLKFQALADHANVAISNVHHHFGGVLEIKRALARRVLEELGRDLATALAAEDPDDPRDYVGNVLNRLYAVLRAPRLAKLIGWMVLSQEVEAVDDLVGPLPLMKAMVAAKIAGHLPQDVADRLADEVIYQVAITALGDGLIGDKLQAALGGVAAAGGSRWLVAYWTQLLQAELDERTDF